MIGSIFNLPIWEVTFIVIGSPGDKLLTRSRSSNDYNTVNACVVSEVLRWQLFKDH